jgi:hypothetical protein
MINTIYFSDTADAPQELGLVELVDICNLVSKHVKKKRKKKEDLLLLSTMN